MFGMVLKIWLKSVLTRGNDHYVALPLVLKKDDKVHIQDQGEEEEDEE